MRFIKMQKKNYWQLIILLLTIFSGCSVEEPQSLRIGVSTWAGFEFLFLAEQKGFFKEENLDVEFVEFSSLSDTRRAYERGQIDGLGTTVVEVFYAREQSPNKVLQIFQIVDSSNGADVILSNIDIKDGKALRGKKIGLELSSLGVYVLARGLETFGLTLADVNTIAMDQMSLGEALSNRTLDAIVTYPPVAIQVQQDTKANTLFSSAQIPNEVIDVLAIDKAVIKQRPSDIKKLLNAYHKAIRYTKENPQDAYRIMSEHEKITPQELEHILTNELHVVTQDEQIEFFKQNGKLSTVVEMTDKILRQTEQIKGADHRADMINDMLVKEIAQ